MKLSKLFTNWRILLLIAILILSVVAISPRLDPEGVAIRQVARNSSAAAAGIENPAPNIAPTSRERITSVNGRPIESTQDFYKATTGLPPDRLLTITTTERTYQLRTQPNYLDPPVTADPANATANGTNSTVKAANATNTTVDPSRRVNGSLDIGLTVYDAPATNLRLGLDLSGGTRVILKPVEPVSEDDLNLIIDNIKQRLNVFGLSDITVRSAKDLSGEDFIIVEIAGANKDEVQALLAGQGKFEAKIGNGTVFRGGQDITSVCRTPDCSGIDRNYGCGQAPDGWACRFSFQISLSPEAAERQADLTRNLSVQVDSGGNYLSEPLTLFLDNEQVDQLQISSDLRGKAATSILISGSGVGTTREAAEQDAIANMKSLQTVLITGSLPVQLEIVKSDGISPALGQEFVDNAMLLGLLTTLAVAIVLVVRYRNWLISIPIIITMFSEILIVLGFAAAVGWNLDLAAIAAIVIAIGSGVNDQIVIIDETLQGGVGHDKRRSWKERIATAFFIVVAAYFTLTAAMIPLWFAGAGLLRGFALTTIVGITAGVLITRPAFAAFMEALLKKEDEE